MRVLLGIAEAGFFPGAVYFLSRWFPDARRARVMGIFYFGAPLSFVFGGPLSGPVLDADGMGGLHGWQWMFLIEGLLASAGWRAGLFPARRQSGKSRVAGAG